ncbi:speckle-type POZ protein B-like [Planococcus citri]|uniref:speckle-type POZ protein B-like n=1 Tax=Planococcus citri TaxID=170843 RepID=UPI0031F84924
MSSTVCGSVCQSNGCKTKVHFDEASYVWIIEDFDFLEVNGKELWSLAFSSTTNDQVDWVLSLSPNGETDAKDSIGLFIYLNKSSRFEKSKKIFAKITFHILSEKSGEYVTEPKEIKEFLHPDHDNTGWGFTVKKDTEFRNKYLSNNTLTIRCEVKFSDVKNITCSPHQHNSDIEMPECNLSENLASLFENQTLTDVVLSVNGKDYPAHKAILAARSPVFCAMFIHNTKESELNRVDIEDINDAVVEGMLKYVYTGKCDDSDELAEGLLAAADKYDLCGLKIICAEKLIKGLSVKRATNALILADMHHHEDLKREAIKFIVANFAQVLNTIGWQNLLLSNPQLVNEVCQDIARK